MTCPKCGFVSFAGLPQCKKCGYRFAQTAEPSPRRQIVLPEAPPAAPTAAEVTSPAARENPALDSAPPTPSPPQPKDWQREVSARVDGYRRRHGRLHSQEESGRNLDFDFEAGGASVERPTAKVQDLPPSGLSGLSLPPIVEEEEAPLGPLASEQGGFVSGEGRPARPAADFIPEAPSEPHPLEIILEAPPSSADARLAPAGLEGALPVAPLGKRFLAGVLDGLVLLLAGGLFELIFWRAGGHFSETPVDLTVIGSVAGFFIFLYFAAFTIFTAATPGLAALGLEVRAAGDGAPNLRDSIWRGIGYLVSISPLMLGFVWSLVDTDSLTWHDRMSGTFVAAREDGLAPAPAREL